MEHDQQMTHGARAAGGDRIRLDASAGGDGIRLCAANALRLAHGWPVERGDDRHG